MSHVTNLMLPEEKKQEHSMEESKKKKKSFHSLSQFLIMSSSDPLTCFFQAKDVHIEISQSDVAEVEC